MARRARIVLTAETESAREDLQNVDAELKDVAEGVERVDRELTELDREVAIAVDLNDEMARQKLRSLANESVEVDVDASRSRRGGGVPTEPEDFVRGFARLSPQLKALTVAAGTSAAVLGAGGALPVAATFAADTLGDPELRQSTSRVKSAFRGVGVELVQEFRPLIRNEVIPAARELAREAGDAADDLATFSEEVIGATQKGREGPRQPGRPARTGVGRFGVGSLQGRGPSEPVARGPGIRSDMRMQLSVPTDQAFKGFRQRVRKEVIQPIQREIEVIRERMAKGLVPKKEARERIKDLRLELDKQLRTLREQSPVLFNNEWLTKNLENLREVEQKLQSLRLNQQLQQIANRIAPLDTINARQAAAAGRRMSFLPRGAQMSDLRGHQFTLQGTSRMMQQVNKMLGLKSPMVQLRQEIQKTNEAAREFGSIGQRMGKGIASSLLRAENAAQKLGGTLLNVVTSLALQQFGFGGGVFGGILQGLTGASIPARRHGGPVSAGVMFETHGLSEREFFIPSTDGRIVTEQQVQMAGGEELKRLRGDVQRLTRVLQKKPTGVPSEDVYGANNRQTNKRSKLT